VLAPHIDGLVTDLVLLGGLGDRRAVGLPQNRPNLFIGNRLFRIGSSLAKEPFFQKTYGPKNQLRSGTLGDEDCVQFVSLAQQLFPAVEPISGARPEPCLRAARTLGEINFSSQSP
jgi:hypothetical protein